MKLLFVSIVFLVVSQPVFSEQENPGVSQETFKNFSEAIQSNQKALDGLNNSNQCPTEAMKVRPIRMTFANGADGKPNTWDVLPVELKKTGKTGDTWSEYQFSFLVGTTDKLRKRTLTMRMETGSSAVKLTLLSGQGNAHADPVVALSPSQHQFTNRSICASAGVDSGAAAPAANPPPPADGVISR